MAFEKLKENVLETDVNIHGYINSSEDYVKLRSFKALMISITFITKTLIIGALTCITLLIVSFAIAFKLSQVLQDTFYGFLIVGLFYVLVVMLVYVFRNKLNSPLIRKFSNYYFTEDETK
ncbi:hypothetical protein [Winogradskyella thalassocola]|uniref:Holin-X, holin superfamily III n=1 Tax=Winogradskyella thalassocola TaxID=262004 RepID=A0A1G8BBV6_9FLAO|nr:hypothetical protein [Winogradskyella thalassocola]SDH30732.1 hypothetical protein SAMN04489796_102285 [Winogradskyella thalassocola]